MERMREAERVRQQNLAQMQRRQEIEKVQRSNLYHQARMEAELNKQRHQEAERRAGNGIFGYDEPSD